MDRGEHPTLTTAELERSDPNNRRFRLRGLRGLRGLRRLGRLRTAVMALAVPMVIAVALILRAGSDQTETLVIAGGTETSDLTPSTAETASSQQLPAIAETSAPSTTTTTDTTLAPWTVPAAPALADPPTCSVLAPVGSRNADASCPRGPALQIEVDWFACFNQQGIPAGTDQPDPVTVSPAVAIAAEATCRSLRPPMATMIIGPYGACMRERGQFFIPGVVVEGFSEARNDCRSQLPPPPFPAQTLAYHDCLRDAGYDVNGPLPGDSPPSGPPTLEAPRAAGVACRHLMVGLGGALPDDYVNCLADQGIFEMIPGPRWHGPGPESRIALQTCSH